MQTIFVAVGAFLGRIDSDTRCAFWADEPTGHGFDPSRLITIDLARTPLAALAQRIRWDAVEVDDCFSGPNGMLGGTTLGPRWPEMQLVGCVQLAQTFWKKLAADIRPACPPGETDGRDYEHMSVVYWPHVDDPRAGKRYAGHHAEILEERGSLARVAVYPRGASNRPNAPPATTMWLDLSSPDQCDAGKDSLTQIAVGTGTKRGALFLTTGSIPSVTA